MSRTPSPVLATVLVLAALQASCVGGLKLDRLEVPKYKLRGDQALLQCFYDLGREELYYIKWYKDDEQFYRYITDRLPAQQFNNVEGVNVLGNRSDDKKVVLQHLSLKSSGIYKCEVSVEGPSFDVILVEAHMEVVVLPEDGPHIFGEQRLYQVGDEISLKCNSGKSHLVSELKWFINDQQVGVDDQRLEQFPTDCDEDGLSSSWLGLRFSVTSAHYVGDSMKLRCVAEVATVVWQGDCDSVVQNVTTPPNIVVEALFLARRESVLILEFKRQLSRL